MPVFCIYPYWHHGCWAFDDPATDLFEEPFVEGASEVISALVEKHQIQDARDGFEIAFSDRPFIETASVIEFVSPDRGGARYHTNIDGEEMEGWLCPNLLRYFESPPARIYLHLSPFGGRR
jgi:hypothetical protein